MKLKNIFIGDIKKCTRYQVVRCFEDTITYINNHNICDLNHIKEDELYKENAVLVKIKEGCYVELDKINTVFDYTELCRNTKLKGLKFGNLMMPTLAYCEGSLFVDSKSVKPYYNEMENEENVSIKQLKKQVG